MTFTLSILELLLEFFWETLPEGIAAAFPGIPRSLHWLWIPTAGMFFAALVGISIYILGFPGDLGYTVACVHELGYVPMGHAPSMIVSSQASILAGGSLGPEAPLVAICASIAGWVSMRLFGVTGRKRLRAHTLSGMACALAAFFGVPLGGSLFALEINHRLGFEYYEHAVVAVASGSTCLVVFRWLAGLAIAPIWNVTPVGAGGGVGGGAAAAADAAGVAAEVGAELAHLGDSSAELVVIGLAFGLLGAAVAWAFAAVHGAIGRWVGRAGLTGRDVPLSLLGGAAICVCAVLVPQSAFWCVLSWEEGGRGGRRRRGAPRKWHVRVGRGGCGRWPGGPSAPCGASLQRCTSMRLGTPAGGGLCGAVWLADLQMAFVFLPSVGVHCTPASFLPCFMRSTQGRI